MRILAYCTLPAREAVKAATGVEPITSPPTTAGDFQAEWLSGHNLIYFRLHGVGQVYGTWFGEGLKRNLMPALDKRHIDAANLGGAVVILANCYGSTSPMVQELYQAGASCVIAGPGQNMAAGNRVIGTDKLARSVITAMRRGWPVKRALQWAKAQLLTTFWRVSDRDALGFRIMEV